jgi:shikimate dehydrogenase
MSVDITGATKVYGIIGYPVKHSLSPVMQNAAIKASSIDGVYVPFEVKPDQLEIAIRGLRATGVSGWNVTIPHKTSIMPFLDQLSDTAEQAGAVNVVEACGEKLIGHNTDGDGLICSLKNDLGCCVEGGSIVVIGAGGAARGAVAALCRAKAAEIIIVNRTASSAESLLGDIAGYYPTVMLSAVAPDNNISCTIKNADLVVNATSVGMYGEEFKWLDLALLKKTAKVYDMIYAPQVTPLIASAKREGIAAANGFGMLVGQGELAFKIWTGAMPAEGVMRSALELYLEHH